MEVSESDQILTVNDIQWDMITLLWMAGLFSLLLLLRLLINQPNEVMLILILLLISGLLLYIAAHVSVKSRWLFDFDKQELLWSQQGLFGRRGGTISFSNIERPFLQADSGIAPDSRRYRLALIHSDGTLPFTPYYLRDVMDYDNLIRVTIRIIARMEIGPFDHDDTIRDLLNRGMHFTAMTQARIIHKLPISEAETYIVKL